MEDSIEECTSVNPLHTKQNLIYIALVIIIIVSDISKNMNIRISENILIFYSSSLPQGTILVEWTISKYMEMPCCKFAKS